MVKDLRLAAIGSELKLFPPPADPHSAVEEFRV